MNSSLLKKAIEELKKADPNIDYLRGMLETLYEMQNPVNAQVDKALEKITPAPEVNVLDQEAKARLKGINPQYD